MIKSRTLLNKPKRQSCLSDLWKDNDTPKRQSCLIDLWKNIVKHTYKAKLP